MALTPSKNDISVIPNLAARNIPYTVLEPLDTVVPTVGFSSVKLYHRNYSVLIYDLGGGAQIRDIWHRYFVDVHGVIFVVDASDVARLDEGRKVLETLLTHDKLAGKPVLLLANKQDKEGALDELDIVERLNVEAIVNQQRCPTLVETCSAVCGGHGKRKVDPGVHNGYKWLLNLIMRDYVRMNARVESDLADQRKLLEQERKDRQERVRLAKEERGDLNGVTVQTQEDTTNTTTTTTTTTTTMMDSWCQREEPATPRRVPHTPVEEETNIPGTVDDSAGRVTSLAGLVNYVELDAEYDVSIATKTSRERIEPSRPSSASSVTGAVREQLELEGKKLKKRKSLLRRSNKTSPAPLGELTLSLGSSPRITLPPLQPRRQQPLSAPSNHAHVRQGSVWGLTKSLDIVLDPFDLSSAEHQDPGIDGKSTKDCGDIT
uniref:ADP-ribosylation factor-like protein 13B n=1 Tax=Timema poppense TaxID=170557 RepID=A0A7R9CZE2_TIMPO|nr:unnamed protein product [Timema poppensis]